MALHVKQYCTIAITCISVFLVRIVVAPDPDMGLVFINCAKPSYGDLEDYAQAVSIATKDIIQQTGLQGGNWYNKAIVGSAICYAHGRCAVDITAQHCGECLLGVYDFMLQECKSSRGVHCKVGSCEFRYDEYAFDNG